MIADLQPTLESEPVRRLLELAGQIDRQNPDPAGLRRLRALFDQHPGLWRTVGDLPNHAARSLLNNLKDQPLVHEALKHGLAALKTDLAYDEASPLERLLIDQVILSWLRLHLLEFTCTGLEPVDSDLNDRRLSAAQGRFLRACHTLARIRKLTGASLALQVNLASHGSQQLNLLTPNK